MDVPLNQPKTTQVVQRSELTIGMIALIMASGPFTDHFGLQGTPLGGGWSAAVCFQFLSREMENK